MKTTLSKAAILPIVSAICLAIGFVTGKPKSDRSHVVPVSQGVAVCNCLPKTAWPPTFTLRQALNM